MNTPVITGPQRPLQSQQQQLPPLRKGPTTYKIIVPRKVEEKIRYLCRKFPTLEWSGILFTTYTGNFEDGSLVITCQDLYPMDLGSSTYTDFRMDETVAGYIVENFDLFGCDMNLLHSHNNMSCFFSGTDLSTLRSEGNDQNCFVSLIVNNAGKYCAAVTRKVNERKTIITKDFSSTYEFFGEGEKIAKVLAGPNEERVIDNTYIEYFDLDVQVEQVDNPLAYLDSRFDEIQASKRQKALVTSTSKPSNPSWNKDGSLVRQTSDSIPIDEDTKFHDWLRQKESREVKEPALFDDETEEMVDTTEWTPNKNLIERAVTRMLVCSLTLKTDKVDLRQWIIRYMDSVYSNIFPDTGDHTDPFTDWVDFSTEYFVTYFDDDSTPWDFIDMDTFNKKVAEAMIDELNLYSELSPYIQVYIEALQRYTEF